MRSVPRIVEATRRLERDERIDALVNALDPAARLLLARPGRAAVLRGRWLGHAIHPLLTDLPLGFWTSASVLDLAGSDARPAARRLMGLGIVAAVPTAVTGVAEWGSTSRPDVRRAGAVHAAANSTALTLYVASYVARRRDRHRAGALIALAAATFAAAGGYLGGHLTGARKVSSYHPAFDELPDGGTGVDHPDHGHRLPTFDVDAIAAAESTASAYAAEPGLDVAERLRLELADRGTALDDASVDDLAGVIRAGRSDELGGRPPTH